MMGASNPPMRPNTLQSPKTSPLISELKYWSVMIYTMLNTAPLANIMPKMQLYLTQSLWMKLNRHARMPRQMKQVAQPFLFPNHWISYMPNTFENRKPTPVMMEVRNMFNPKYCV